MICTATINVVSSFRLFFYWSSRHATLVGLSVKRRRVKGLNPVGSDFFSVLFLLHRSKRLQCFVCRTVTPGWENGTFFPLAGSFLSDRPSWFSLPRHLLRVFQTKTLFPIVAWSKPRILQRCTCTLGKRLTGRKLFKLKGNVLFISTKKLLVSAP